MKFEKNTKVSANFATYWLQRLLVSVFCLAGLCCAEVFEMNGMPPPAMRINYSSGSLAEGGVLTATITIPEKWHVNANVAADEFLKPSSIELKAEGIEFGEPVWPTAKEQYSEALDFVNKIFEGTFQITIPVKSVAKTYDSTSTTATFGYQACSNSICLAPASVTVSLSLNGAKVPEKEKELLQQGKKDSTQAVTESAPPKSSRNSVIFLLLMAFLGGVILNLMPCVLPVLSLKLFSLIKQAGASKGRLMALGLSTTLGILVSFWILAGVVIALRLGGGNPGWGMQFQSSGFILAMVAILTLFALSFFGVFEVWLPGNALTKIDGATHQSGLHGAFFTGALLVLLSTPCSAPFLGSAMGFAFNQSGPVLIIFFTVAGLGLALPYLIISVCPSLLKFLPKPGTWMVVLQKVMGGLLFVTIAWLLWISFRAYSVSGITFFGIAFVLNFIAAFAIGKIAPPGSSFVKEMEMFAIVIVLNIGLKIGMGESLQPVSIVEEGYIAYSDKAVDELRSKGIIVFVDVTADWCITCKANEAAVLNNEDLDEFFKRNNVQKVKADWTHGDKKVTKLLKSLGKSGVPAYAVFPIDKTRDPMVLSEILTTSSIEDAINNAK